MATAVVQSHPLDDSYSAALLDAAVDGLSRKGIEPVVVRLGDGDTLDAATVESADHLVVVYPVWWGTMPAMLLGPITELLGPWVDGGSARSSSPLRSVRRLTVVTSYGGSRWINLLQGEAGRHFWSRTVMKLCAPGAVFEQLAIYDVVDAGEAELATFIEHVRSTLSATG